MLQVVLQHDDLSNRLCVSNETEDLNLHVFNMIAGRNKSRTLSKYILSKCECKCDSVVICDEIIEYTKSYSRKSIPAKSASTKTIPTRSTSTKTF